MLDRDRAGLLHCTGIHIVDRYGNYVKPTTRIPFQHPNLVWLVRLPCLHLSISMHVVTVNLDTLTTSFVTYSIPPSGSMCLRAHKAPGSATIPMLLSIADGV